MCIDLAAVSSVAVSAVALIVAALALAQDRSLAQNPIVCASFNAKHGQLTKGVQDGFSRISFGPRDYLIEFKVQGPGAVYAPSVAMEDTRKDDGGLKWAYRQKDNVLTAESGSVEIFIEAYITKPGLFVVFSFDRPRRFRRGATAVHYRYAIPRHNRDDEADKTEIFKRGKWRRIKMKQIQGPSVENPVKEDRKLRDE